MRSTSVNFLLVSHPDAELRERLGLNGSRVLGFIGSFYAYEGLPLLLDALPKMLNQTADIRILLVGGGPQEDLLKEKVKGNDQISDKVIFTGRVPHQEVQRYYDFNRCIGISPPIYAFNRISNAAETIGSDGTGAFVYRFGCGWSSGINRGR